MILSNQVQIYNQKVDSFQNKKLEIVKTADCRFSFNSTTTYSQNGNFIEFDGNLQTDTQLNKDNIVSFDSKNFYSLEQIKETKDLDGDFLFTYCKLRKTNGISN